MKKTIQTFYPVTAMNNPLNHWKARMTNAARAFGLGVMLFAAAAPAHAASLIGSKTLSGHIPAAVSHLKAKRDLAADTNLNLAISLPLRNTDEMEKLLADIYNPASPNYQHYLTPDEFTAKFGPTKQDYEMVANFARAHGLKITGTHSNRTILDVQGKARDIEN